MTSLLQTHLWDSWNVFLSHPSVSTEDRTLNSGKAILQQARIICPDDWALALDYKEMDELISFK